MNKSLGLEQKIEVSYTKHINTENKRKGECTTMEKYSVFGEILYIGFVLEKGRCKSSGIWGLSYTRNLKKHIKLLERVAECMQNRFDVEADNILLREVCHELQADKVLKKHYPFHKVLDKINHDENMITECQESNQHLEIILLIRKLLEDILTELDKGIKKDKKRIGRMIFALHNLPRVYLREKASTLFMLGQKGITTKDAFSYSKSWMDENMLSCYEQFFVSATE